MVETTEYHKYDDNNVSVAFVQETSVSNHSITVPPGGYFFNSSKNGYKRDLNYRTNSAQAVVTTKTTPVSLSPEKGANKTTVTKTVRDTGTKTLSKENTSAVRKAVQEKGGGVTPYEKYFRYISQPNDKKQNNNNVVDSPRR